MREKLDILIGWSEMTGQAKVFFVIVGLIATWAYLSS